jgi:hypothetical protein
LFQPLLYQVATSVLAPSQTEMKHSHCGKGRSRS